ncbi:DUF1871 family protein [Macrococcus equipercicus]|uniref:DUF1871 family protein n=2 Tax=Macrococcus equipercicus TaxID=69967 RepID=A0ABQ6RBJ9_9STAP|nr:DUF1871 family protein [Macrococcus equipercicus]
MMNAEFNIELYKLIADWNPMKFEDASMGDQEVYDCMDIIHQTDDRDETVKRIQHVYHFSFDQYIPAEEIHLLLDRVATLNMQCKL